MVVCAPGRSSRVVGDSEDVAVGVASLRLFLALPPPAEVAWGPASDANLIPRTTPQLCVLPDWDTMWRTYPLRFCSGTVRPEALIWQAALS